MTTSEAPQNVTAISYGPGQILAGCDAVTNATHYRFFTQRPLVDPKPVFAGHSPTPTLVITDLTPCGNTVFLFTDQGDLITARLSPEGFHEISRAHLLEATSPFGGKKRVWTPPAYANRHVFARNDEELICVSLEAKK